MKASIRCGTRLDRCLDMCRDMQVDMRVGACIRMCIDVRIDIATDISIEAVLAEASKHASHIYRMGADSNSGEDVVTPRCSVYLPSANRGSKILKPEDSNMHLRIDTFVC